LIKKAVVGYDERIIYEIIYQYDELGRFLSYLVLQSGFKIKGFRECGYFQDFSHWIPMIDAEYNPLGEKLGHVKNSWVDLDVLRTDFFYQDQFLGFSLSKADQKTGDVVTQETYDVQGKPVDMIMWQQLIDYSRYQ
jgi:hypothetical protein